MKDIIITLIFCSLFAWCFTQINNESKAYELQQSRDSTEMYRKALLKHNDGKLRKNREFNK